VYVFWCLYSPHTLQYLHICGEYGISEAYILYNISTYSTYCILSTYSTASDIGKCVKIYLILENANLVLFNIGERVGSVRVESTVFNVEEYD